MSDDKKTKFPDYGEFDEIEGVLSEDFIDSVESEFFVVDTIPEKDIKSLEKEVQKLKKKKIVNDENGFNYESKCRCCNLALEDPDIHKLYLVSNQKPGTVKKYIEEKYNETIKWDSIKRHMDQHFLPVYDAVSYKRKENLLNIKKWIKEREDAALPSRLDAMEEMLYQKYENIFIKSCDQGIPLQEDAFIGKNLASIANTLMKIQEFKWTMLGSNKTPEEMQKIYTEAVKGLIQRVINKIPDENQKKEIMFLIQKEFNSGGL